MKIRESSGGKGLEAKLTDCIFVLVFFLQRVLRLHIRGDPRRRVSDDLGYGLERHDPRHGLVQWVLLVDARILGQLLQHRGLLYNRVRRHLRALFLSFIRLSLAGSDQMHYCRALDQRRERSRKTSFRSQATPSSNRPLAPAPR
jgi:hypothetical protein